MTTRKASERKQDRAKERVLREIRDLTTELTNIYNAEYSFEEKIDLLTQELSCTLTMLTVINKRYSVDMNHYTDYKDKAEDDLEATTTLDRI